MPECLKCRMLVGRECSGYKIAKKVLGRKIPGPPLGGCVIPIVEEYKELIQPNSKVLEIGCGSWDAIQSHCIKVQAYYEGIDTLTEYFGRNTIATRFENLANLSYSDDTFDFVIGNQTMEHWGEYGCRLEWGLHHCFRVCKKGGMVLLNVPIHFHGTKEFMLGDLSRIKRLLSLFSSTFSMIEWGHPSCPLPDQFPFPGYWRLSGRPAYVLDIRASKDRSVSRQWSNNGAAYGRCAQILNYPFSYNIYRVLRKAGIFR